MGLTRKEREKEEENERKAAEKAAKKAELAAKRGARRGEGGEGRLRGVGGRRGGRRQGGRRPGRGRGRRARRRVDRGRVRGARARDPREPAGVARHRAGAVGGHLGRDGGPRRPPRRARVRRPLQEPPRKAQAIKSIKKVGPAKKRENLAKKREAEELQRAKKAAQEAKLAEARRLANGGRLDAEELGFFIRSGPGEPRARTRTWTSRSAAYSCTAASRSC